MIVFELTVFCAECSKSSVLKPEVSQVRTIVRGETTVERGGKPVGGVLHVQCCQHCSVVETTASSVEPWPEPGSRGTGLDDWLARYLPPSEK